MIELCVRIVKPPLPFQVVKASDGPNGLALREVDGVPVWHRNDPEDRWRTQCAIDDPRSLRIVFFGSSITFGVGYDAQVAFPAILEGLLRDDAATHDVCVMNFAEPAFDLGAKLALARERVPVHEPDLVVWELWSNDAHPFTMLRDRAYSWRGNPLDAQGYPDVLRPMSRPLHRFLFMNSAAWHHLTLVVSNRSWGTMQPSSVLAAIAREKTLAFSRELSARGTRMALIAAPWLDRPFRQSLGEGRHGISKAIVPAAARVGIPTFEIAAELVDVDPEQVRRDPCCHYNPRGHRLIGEALHRWLTREHPPLLHNPRRGAPEAVDRASP